MRDLHELPKLRDSLSYLYLEHGKIEQTDAGIECFDKEGGVRVPAAALCVLMLGPGTSITHAAVKALGESGCSIVWCGQDGLKFYAQGTGETRRGHQILKQAELVSDPRKRLKVVMRMYQARFGYRLSSSLSVEQIRGMEGVRVREAYAKAAEKYGVVWAGRRYDRGDWNNADPVNRALSAANACLNGLCHAAIVSGGYSPALGFVHTGKQLSFVYDVADLYKADVTVPIAFKVAAAKPAGLESLVRQECREGFKRVNLLERILPDIDKILDLGAAPHPELAVRLDADGGLPMPLWTPEELESTVEEKSHDSDGS